MYCERDPSKYPIGSFSSRLVFKIRDVDPETNEVSTDDVEDLDDDEFNVRIFFQIMIITVE